jgi:hypothetical protein
MAAQAVASAACRSVNSRTITAAIKASTIDDRRAC